MNYTAFENSIKFVNTGVTFIEPTTAKGKLCYYLNSIDSLFNYEIFQGRYKNHTTFETDAQLIYSATLYNQRNIPTMLETTEESLLKGNINEFYTITAESEILKLVVNPEVSQALIGVLNQKRVLKVLFYSPAWYRKFYLNPLNELSNQRQLIYKVPENSDDQNTLILMFACLIIIFCFCPFTFLYLIYYCFTTESKSQRNILIVTIGCVCCILPSMLMIGMIIGLYFVARILI